LADILFGEWLKRRRKAMGFTQEQLAKLVNCSKSTLRKIESEERRPSIQLIDLFVDVFNIPAGQRNSFLNFARGDLQVNNDQFMAESLSQSLPTPRLSIPSSATSLIGREREVAEICEYLQKNDIRLVTLIGPPGIGKTRLSLESAREVSGRFPEGVFFCRAGTP
jgi:transcriptional regulator with XRE-family HTH domain